MTEEFDVFISLYHVTNKHVPQSPGRVSQVYSVTEEGY